MAFEELQDRLKNEALQTLDRLNENSLFLSLKDRYQGLPTLGQKVVIIAAIVVMALIIGLVPYGTYQAANDSLISFEEKRSLIRDLLRTHKEAQDNPINMPMTNLSDVQSRVDSILTSQILPEQKLSIVRDAPTSLINESLVDGVLKVSVAQLNLKQVTSISADFASIQGAKLKDILMDASRTDPRYYDVVYRIVVFKSNAPPEAEPEDNPPPTKKRGGR